MIHYSINSNSRTKIYFYIAVISILITSFFPAIFNEIQMNQYYYAPSALTIFFFLLFLTDNFLWKLPIINYLIGVSNVNGVWEGIVVRNNDVPFNAKITVSQTWSKIQIRLETQSNHTDKIIASGTYSIAKAVGLKEENQNIELNYIYDKYIIGDANQNNSEGEGAAKIILSKVDNYKVLEGGYYNKKKKAGTFNKFTKVN
jgi:hypothetical protein